jgi:hypothetical protein
MKFVHRLKGNVAQAVFQALLQDCGYEVVPFGVEQVIREIAPISRANYERLGLMETLLSDLPDFFVSNLAREGRRLVESLDATRTIAEEATTLVRNGKVDAAIAKLNKVISRVGSQPNSLSHWLVEVKYRKDWNKTVRSDLKRLLLPQALGWSPLWFVLFLGADSVGKPRVRVAQLVSVSKGQVTNVIGENGAAGTRSGGENSKGIEKKEGNAWKYINAKYDLMVVKSAGPDVNWDSVDFDKDFGNLQEVFREVGGRQANDGTITTALIVIQGLTQLDRKKVS